jgi:L-seryl-tRNA(Ser) seleniumtransferase
MIAEQSFLHRLNIPTVINASGTLTSLGGCRTRPEVLQAMAEIAGEFVPLGELHQSAGDHLASILGVDAAMVTSGAAAALTLAAAACMLTDEGGRAGHLAACLPSPPPKYKVIIQCSHRNPFERAIPMAGAALLQVGDAIQTRAVDLEAAISQDAAAVVYFLQAAALESSLNLMETLEIAHAHHVPVIVDAAAELPPKHHLWQLAKDGADLVIFSGSKDLRGPQTSGLMVGRADLIRLAMRQTAPHEHVIGRPLKAGKEIVAGLLTAVELYLAEDESIRFAEWEKTAKYIDNDLGATKGLKTRIFTPSQPFIQPTIIPRVAIELDPALHLTVKDLKRFLWAGNPPIAVELVHDELWINTHTLTMPEAEIIIQRIKEAVSTPKREGG